jgi:hypothetical protein
MSAKLVTRFAGSVPKHFEYPDQNEDAWAADDPEQHYVLSDGASESFNSALWSQLIVKAWPKPTPQTKFARLIGSLARQYDQAFDKASFSWSQEAAFGRGSFASLLSVTNCGDGTVLVVAIGDSTAVLVKAGAVGDSFPYHSADQFRQRPHLLSTIYARNRIDLLTTGYRAFKSREPGGPCHVHWSIDGADTSLLCMTDALAEWLLSNPAERLPTLFSIGSDDDLRTLVEAEREAGAMRRDDVTLIVLQTGTDATASDT